MTKARKTLPVTDLVDRGNRMLRSPRMTGDDKHDARLAVIHFMECILHDSGQYRGFHYFGIDRAEIAGLDTDDPRSSQRAYYRP